MKRLVLLIALLLVLAASALNAQVQRRVLEEEFTNTGCPPCAATDPYIEDYEAQYIDKICVVKYHVSWPDNTDPFYNAQKVKTADDARCQSYYGQNGVPYIKLSGLKDPMYRLFNVSGTTYDMMKGDLVDSTDAISSMTSPFTIDITQQIIGDSIIAIITVKAVAAPPAVADLRLACEFGERFNPFHGSNGRPYYTSIVRDVLPGLTSGGVITTTANYPAFTINNGETKIIRFGDTIGKAWNRSQLMTVAFIQSAAKKEIYQANWTVPNIGVTVSGGSDFDLAPSGTTDMTLTNKSNKDQVVSISYSAPDVPSNWVVKMQGTDVEGKGTVTVPANGTKDIMLSMSVTGNAIGSANGAFFVSSAEGAGVGGIGAAYFGQDNKDVIVDGGAGVTNLIQELTDMNNSGLKAGIADRTQFMNFFSDWSTFKTVYIAAGSAVGIQVGNTEWPNLSSHLADGGNVLFTGSRSIGIYQASGNDSYMQNWRDNFHIDPTANTTSTWSKVTGVTGDPIGNGVSSTLNPKTPYRQGLVASDDAFQGLFSNEKKDTVGMKALSGAGKVVYLSFELESLPAADRTSVSKRIIDWFNGTASVKTSNEASAVKISNYPNPVVKSTKFDYSLTERGLVNLAIYDVMGREVSRLVSNEMEDQGTYTADFDASHLSNGSYTYVLTTGPDKVVGTMTVTK